METPEAPPAAPRRALRAWVLAAVAMAAVTLGVVLIFVAAPTQDEQSIDGVVLEAFDADGTVALADLTGRPLVINAWASWCGPCVEEMPSLQQMYTEFGSRVGFLGVNVQDDPERARRLVGETGVTYPLAADPDMRIFRELGGVGMPTTWFVDEGGRIIERHTGLLTTGELRELFTRHFGS